MATNYEPMPPHNGSPPVKIFGRTASSRGYMIRGFLHRNDVPFEWIELMGDDAARSQAGV
jgi:thioredoxin reductase (NADPH)